MADAWHTAHLCEPQHAGLPGGMRDLYALLGLLATSTAATTVLIRSHIAYWCGRAAAERATIKPSRGHSYKVNGRQIVRIVDYYDHRKGVTGIMALGLAE